MLFNDTILSEQAKEIIKLKKKEAQIFKIVLDNRGIKGLVKHLNTEEQLYKERVDSLGERLGVYSHATEKLSKGRKKAGEFINLFDTGEFYDSWKVEVKKEGIVINANPFKDDTDLFREYGIDILGLTDENLQILINEATKFYITYFKEVLKK